MSTPNSSIHRETLSYTHDGKTFAGTLVHDGAFHGRRPGVLIAHAWMGLDDFARKRAVQVARLGYTALALDMYGEGRNAKDNEEAATLMNELRGNRPLLRARAQAGLKALRSQRLVESRNIAAMGYCFGGCVALELARSGADIRGVVSFHGLLDSDGTPPGGPLLARILALHGADDPLVPPKQVAAFQKEMSDAGADWQWVSYGGTVHAFTNPNAGSDISTGMAYNPTADARSWIAARSFLEEVLG